MADTGRYRDTIVALLQLGPWWALWTLLGLTLIQQVLGSIVDPRLAGRTLDISPIVVLPTIVFWGWGVVGALVGVLLTTTILIILDHMPGARLAAGGDSTQPGVPDWQSDRERH